MVFWVEGLGSYGLGDQGVTVHGLVASGSGAWCLGFRGLC